MAAQPKEHRCFVLRWLETYKESMCFCRSHGSTTQEANVIGLALPSVDSWS